MTGQLRHHAHDEGPEQLPKLQAEAEMPHEELVQLPGEGPDHDDGDPHPAASKRTDAELFHKLVRPGVRLDDRLQPTGASPGTEREGTG